MSEYDKFIGKWVWENGNKEERYIEFNEVNGKLQFSINIKGKEIFQPENLKLNIFKEEKEDVTSYLFTNNWLSKDENKIFSIECQFISDLQDGIFINAQEIKYIDDNHLKQKLYGYRFKKNKEKWANFERKDILIRIQ